jgi:hypothetical protein
LESVERHGVVVDGCELGHRSWTVAIAYVWRSLVLVFVRAVDGSTARCQAKTAIGISRVTVIGRTMAGQWATDGSGRVDTNIELEGDDVAMPMIIVNVLIPVQSTLPNSPASPCRRPICEA